MSKVDFHGLRAEKFSKNELKTAKNRFRLLKLFDRHISLYTWKVKKPTSVILVLVSSPHSHQVVHLKIYEIGFSHVAAKCK
jgi:hypothetical protein